MSSCWCRLLEDCVLVQGSPHPPYIGQRMRSVPGLLDTTRRPKSTLHILLYPVNLLRSKSTEVLSCIPSIEVVLNKVAQGIFWKVFRRSCGLPTRSVGPTDRSASLLVCWTHLSKTAVSLIGGDPVVPMSHRCC
jgi:hypothetical protein